MKQNGIDKTTGRTGLGKLHAFRQASAGFAVLVGFLFLGGSIHASTFSGRVTDSGVGVSGVRIHYTWSGIPGDVFTDANGDWSSPGWVPGFAVTFSALQSGFTFSGAQSYTAGILNVDDVNFTRTSYGISGTVRVGGVGVGGVTVSLSGPSNRVAITSSSGSYSFVRLPTGTFTLTPSHPNFSFAPANLQTTLGPTRSGQNFQLRNPLATSLAATAVGFGSATLNGSVIGDGTIPTRVWFEYGVSTNFGSATAVQILSPATNPVPVSAVTPNLSGGLNYNFRCVAANDNATNYGGAQTFFMPFPAAGTALNFNGTNQYVSAGTNPVLKVTTNLTIEAWINPTGPGNGASGIGGVIAGREGEYLLARFADGTIRIGIANTSPGWVFTNTFVIVPTNRWTHVAFTYDANAPINRIRLYTNGVLAYTGQGSGPIGDAVPTQNEFRIGGRTGLVQYFQGQIDEVRIWNMARTEAEIFNNFRRRLTGSEPRLLAYFPFDEGIGTTTTDRGPNSLTGTLGNGASFVPSGALIQDPVAATLPAAPVLATVATLRATVIPSGAATDAYFEYGTSLAFGQRTLPAQQVGNGLAPVAISASVTNLNPGTTYYFRPVANNSFTSLGAPSTGATETFTTLVLGCGWPISTKLTDGNATSPKHVVDADGNAYVAGVFSGSATFNKTLVPTGGGGTNAFIGKLARGADWMWSTNIPLSANGSMRINALALDSARNVYLAGQFSGTATFGANNLVSRGSNDTFVAKLSGGTNWLWAKSVGNTDADGAYALAVGPSGNLYVAGQFTRTNTFSNTIGSFTLISSNTDIFVAKMDTNGNWLWATNAPANGANDLARALVVDSSENIYVAGAFSGTAVFGGTNLNSGAAGNQDLFVAKIDSAGNWLLARRGGGANNDTATALAIDAADQIFLLGQFTGTADYAGSLTNLNSGGGANLFVAKLNSSASVLWYAQGGNGFGESIAADSNGHIYISGEFPFATTFGSPPAISLTTAGNSDVFLAELSADNGAWNWATNIGSSGNEFRGSIAVDAAGGVVVSGSYQNTFKIGYVLLSSPNDSDIFVARLDANHVYEHNSYVIGQAIPIPVEAQDPMRPDGGAFGQPTITILEKEHVDSDVLSSFVWSLAEKKLYPVRPVTAVFKWPLTADVTNTVLVAACVGRTVLPAQPQIHIATAPVELEPAVPGYPFRYVNLAFTTVPGASVDAGSKQFSATQPGWTVLQFLNTGGELPNPTLHPSKFEVVRSILWNDPTNNVLVDNQPAPIGTALTHPAHNDPTGKNGHVLFERAFYDGTGDERAYDRVTRTGPIIPVNKDTTTNNDDLVVVWYRTNLVTGIAWPSLPVRYIAQWPADADELVLASGVGSGVLDALEFPAKRVYHQPDKTLPGFNPNEEHASLYGDVLYALRNDLNTVIKVSDPFVLLKYRDPSTMDWAMKVFKVVSTNTSYSFVYSGEAGQELQRPAPLSLLSLCGLSNRVVSGPGFQDYAGRLYARAAGSGTNDTNIVTRYWYPLQPDFFYDLNGDGIPEAPVGTCVPWLDRLPVGVVDGLPVGDVGVPRHVTYAITWPSDVPTLEIGATLFNARSGLPDLRHFASASVVYDEGNRFETNSLSSLVRMFDPLSERTLQLSSGFKLPPGIQTANVAGRVAFAGLPYVLRSRLFYDDLNKRLSFGGLLSEDVKFGGEENPLLLINVLSPRERDRIWELSTDVTFRAAIDKLYDLTRNPNRIDRDGDREADQDLLIGLTAPNLNTNNNVRTGPIQAEKLGDIPKVLTAGPGTGSGFVTIVENNDPSLGGLPVTLHVIRIGDGPYRGDLKVLYPDNVFDEKLTLRHSGDFGGEPQKFEFEWYYQPDSESFNSTNLPTVAANGNITNFRGWLKFTGVPLGVNGFNDITIGDGGESSLLTLADNWFICRYRGYSINGQTNVWSDWVGAIGGGEAQLAEGWVKRVIFGLNPFDARTADFHANETVTFASMLQQAGTRYEGDIAFNPDGGNINSVGLIEAYETVLRRARHLSIDGSPGINYAPANNALLLAASRIADFYMLLGNEAFADAADPTIGFRTDGAGYGTLAPSIFTFQNQLDSLIEEEIVLLRGRDDRSATVRSAPVYNRLFWNFTHDEGEVAYAQAYNITDRNSDGFINANDARVMYPQGHGDAWGHYLTATKAHYSLLQSTNFDWVPRTESIQLAGVPVEVDYLDERKFARAAAAKAKTGGEIVDLTYRLNYVDDPEGQFQGYKDTDSSRAWGLSEWGHRAGSAAFFDWVLANAILPAVDPNTNHVGIEKIDRTTVSEVDEIVTGYEAVQGQVNKADAGLNPLGIAKNAVPFDIDPTLVSAGKTHFEQIYDRALNAVNNTVTVFNHANQLSQALRSLQDSVNSFSENSTERERDFKNRMIEVFGYPYAGDIGPGRTYPSGYDGPDLYHYMYVNTVELDGDTAPPSDTFTAFFQPKLGLNVTKQKDFTAYFLMTPFGDVKKDFGGASFYFPDDVPTDSPGARLTTNILSVTYPFSAADFGFTAPASWGQRRAPGEIQMALSDFLQNQARFKQAQLNYDNLILKIQDSTNLLQARYNLEIDKVRIRNKAKRESMALTAVIQVAKFAKGTFTEARTLYKDFTKTVIDGLPTVVGTASDVMSAVRASMRVSNAAADKGLRTAETIAGAAEEIAKTVQDGLKDSTALEIEKAGFEFEIQQQFKALEELIREEVVLRVDAFTQREVLDQSLGRYLAAVAKGLRLAEERTAFRKSAAAHTQASRYQDMTFRIFRNDAIQKYRAQFDLAAQYVFLAAVAYDFDTQLLGDRSGAGRAFLTDIIRQRSLGQIEGGVPVAGRHGLGDPLARLGQNFSVLKGQLGFNNPQTETGRFSLRSELFRISTNNHEAWRAELKKSIVPNLWDVPEFRRYCRPFAPEAAGPQPGLVIRFPTTVTFGLNYFGWPLGGGDNAYDPTLFATKVRSAGIWFENYLGSGLSQTPRVYLVPAGADVLRSPSGLNLEIREWRVVDQKIPVPFPIGFASLNNSAWIPMNDSLSDTFADIRRFSSFRAYNDSGGFTPAEATTDSRLIGRSVWNTDWMLIIPGGTFLFDPNQGLDTFINSVGDIKIFFQTYAYSGN